MMNPNILNQNPPNIFFDRAVNAQRSQLLYGHGRCGK